jgi:hypothetical protein
MKSEEPGKISDVSENANFLLVLVWYIPGQFDPGIWVQD